MVVSMGWESLECCSDGNLLRNDKMAFPVFHVPQKDLPSCIICCLNIHISVRKKRSHKSGVELYLDLHLYSSTNICYEKNDQKSISFLESIVYCFSFFLQSKELWISRK